MIMTLIYVLALAHALDQCLSLCLDLWSWPWS